MKLRILPLLAVLAVLPAAQAAQAAHPPYLVDFAKAARSLKWAAKAKDLDQIKAQFQQMADRWQALQEHGDLYDQDALNALEIDVNAVVGATVKVFGIPSVYNFEALQTAADQLGFEAFETAGLMGP